MGWEGRGVEGTPVADLESDKVATLVCVEASTVEHLTARRHFVV